MTEHSKGEESLAAIERIRAGVRRVAADGRCPQCGGTGLWLGKVHEVFEGGATVSVAICRGCDAADRMLAERVTG